MWFCESVNGYASVVKIDMLGNTSEYPLQPTLDAACDVLTPNPDKTLYFLQVALDGTISMGHISMSGQVSYLNLSESIESGSMVSGSDGNLWIVTSETQHIYRVTTSGVVTEYQNPDEYPPVAIEGPDGNVWFGQNCTYRRNDTTRTGKITPQGVITLYPLDCGSGLAAGEDGGIWYYADREMLRIDPATGTDTIYPTNVQTPHGNLWPGPDGNLYFLVWPATGSWHLQAYNVFTHKIDLYTLIPGTNVEGVRDVIAMGPDKNMWMANPNDNQALVVYLYREILTSPSSIQESVGQTVPMSAAEKHVGNAHLSATSNNLSIATVSGSDGSFMIYGVKSGTTTVTISDNLGNSLNVPVTVN
jgi:hypothetical protein